MTPRLLPGWLAQHLRHAVLNLQSVARAFSVAERHYDVGNDLFAAMLDSRMIYSCASWARASDVEQAQLDKLELIARKLDLQRGERLLDVGCGWGGLAAHAAQRFGSQVVGATVSHESRPGWRASAALDCRCRSRSPTGDRCRGATTSSHRWACSSTWDRRTTWPTSAACVSSCSPRGCSCCTRSAAAARRARPTPGPIATSSPTPSCRPRRRSRMPRTACS